MGAIEDKYSTLQRPLSRNERLLYELILNGGGSGSGSGSGSTGDGSVEPDDVDSYITGPDAASIFDQAEQNANNDNNGG